MNRRGFFGKLIKGAAVVAVAPMVIASIVPTPVAASIMYRGFGKTARSGWESIRVQGRTYHMYKGVEDAMIRHKMDKEYALLFGKPKFCIPRGKGMLDFINLDK